MVEMALVFPLFLVLLFGLVSFGIAIFYQQQVTNAAREAARYAAIHSATSQCPTASRLAPMPPPSDRYHACDSPEEGWPDMTTHAQSLVFGLPAMDVQVAACWAGYVEGGAYDAPPPGDYALPDGSVRTVSSTWSPCTIGGVDPLVTPAGVPCTSSVGASTVDTASNLSEGPGRIVANQVVAYTCYVWNPPLGGIAISVPCDVGWCSIEIIPSEITLRGVVSEPIQRQG